MKLIFTKKPIVFGLLAAIILLEFYFLVLASTSSSSYAIWQFRRTWHWILLLAAGFGTQAGLYFFIRESQKKISLKPLAASGSISAGSMVACCLHHLADFLPLLGLAGAALFLIQYQVFFLFLGVLSNAIGIILMLEVVKKYQLYPGHPFLERISVYDFGKAKKFAIAISLILLLFAYFSISKQADLKVPEENSALQDAAPQNKTILPSRTDTQNGITFEAVPLDFDFTKPVQFGITITTHSGSLDFDPAKISALKNGNGDQFAAVEWQGSPAGGHHRSGVLVFPKLSAQTKTLTLIINDGYQRIFEWDLR